MDHRPRAARRRRRRLADRPRGRECRVQRRRVSWIAVRVVPTRRDRARVRHRRAGDGTGRGDAGRVELPRLHQFERGPSRAGPALRRVPPPTDSSASFHAGPTSKERPPPTSTSRRSTIHRSPTTSGSRLKILDRVEAELCIDRSRIFVSGFSNGGMFAATLGCALSDRVAAVASVAGVHLLPDCRGRPMPIIVIHGSADDMVPFSEGDVGPAADIREMVRGLGGNEAQAPDDRARHRDVGQVLGRVVGETERMPPHRPGRGVGIRGRDDGVSELPSGRRRGAPGDRGRWTRLAPGPRVGHDGSGAVVLREPPVPRR